MASATKSSVDFIAAAESVLASNDDAARKQMMGAAMRAMAMLESPVETIWKVIMSVRLMKTKTSLNF
jgi:hypothetical protein